MLNKRSLPEQTASHLRRELGRGRWTGTMPGRDKLTRELGVHGSTVERALQQLEDEGILKKEGPGKARRIVSTGSSATKARRVGILLYGPDDGMDEYVLSLQNHFKASKHDMVFAPRAMSELKFDPKRIEAMLKKQSVDAWIVYSGSKEILQRLVQLPTPVFALFGRMSEVKIAGAGTDILPALRDTVAHLAEQGHRRIVMLTRAQLVDSGLGLTERTFLEALEENDIPHGDYNLAGLDNTREGLRQCLDKLFEVSPPTAIFVDHWGIHNAVQNYLLRARGGDHHKLCCISMDSHPTFSFCDPQVPHFYWDHEAVVKRAMAWLNRVGRGKAGTTQNMIRAEFRGQLTAN